MSSSEKINSLSATAPEFLPVCAKPGKVKKTKQERASPRVRRRHKERLQEEAVVPATVIESPPSPARKHRSSKHKTSEALHMIDDDAGMFWINDVMGRNMQRLFQRRQEDGLLGSPSVLISPNSRALDAKDFESLLYPQVYSQSNETFTAAGLLDAQDININSIQWLQMQTEWAISKQSLFIDDEIVDDESKERAKWGEWARNAAELERRRRVLLLKELDEEETKERMARRRWAIDAIERERMERISASFLQSLTTTPWYVVYRNSTK